MTALAIELIHSAETLKKYPWVIKINLNDFLSPDLPCIGDGVSFASSELVENAELVVTSRKFVYEPGQTTVVIWLGLLE